MKSYKIAQKILAQNNKFTDVCWRLGNRISIDSVKAHSGKSILQQFIQESLANANGSARQR